MSIFSKGNKNSGTTANSKLRDFLKNESVDDAEIIFDESFDREAAERQRAKSGGNGANNKGLSILAICLIAGLLAGFIYGRFFAGPGGERFASFDAASLTRNVQTTKVERVKYISEVLYSDVDVYDKPSNISGVVVAKLGRDMKVEHLGLVPSLDTKENVGVTCFDIKISRLFSKSFIIPEGTKVNLLGYNGGIGEYEATVSVDGKLHNITVNSNEIKLPYTRGWVKVRTEYGQEGYVYGETVSVRSMK